MPPKMTKSDSKKSGPQGSDSKDPCPDAEDEENDMECGSVRRYTGHHIDTEMREEKERTHLEMKRRIIALQEHERNRRAAAASAHVDSSSIQDENDQGQSVNMGDIGDEERMSNKEDCTHAHPRSESASHAQAGWEQDQPSSREEQCGAGSFSSCESGEKHQTHPLWEDADMIYAVMNELKGGRFRWDRFSKEQQTVVSQDPIFMYHAYSNDVLPPGVGWKDLDWEALRHLPDSRTRRICLAKLAHLSLSASEKLSPRDAFFADVVLADRGSDSLAARLAFRCFKDDRIRWEDLTAKEKRIPEVVDAAFRSGKAPDWEDLTKEEKNTLEIYRNAFLYRKEMKLPGNDSFDPVATITYVRKEAEVQSESVIVSKQGCSANKDALAQNNTSNSKTLPYEITKSPPVASRGRSNGNKTRQVNPAGRLIRTRKDKAITEVQKNDNERKNPAKLKRHLPEIKTSLPPSSSPSSVSSDDALALSDVSAEDTPKSDAWDYPKNNPKDEERPRRGKKVEKGRVMWRGQKMEQGRVIWGWQKIEKGRIIWKGGKEDEQIWEGQKVLENGRVVWEGPKVLENSKVVVWDGKKVRENGQIICDGENSGNEQIGEGRARKQAVQTLQVDPGDDSDEKRSDDVLLRRGFRKFARILSVPPEHPMGEGWEAILNGASHTYIPSKPYRYIDPLGLKLKRTLIRDFLNARKNWFAKKARIHKKTEHLATSTAVPFKSDTDGARDGQGEEVLVRFLKSGQVTWDNLSDDQREIRSFRCAAAARFEDLNWVAGGDAGQEPAVLRWDFENWFFWAFRRDTIRWEVLTAEDKHIYVVVRGAFQTGKAPDWKELTAAEKSIIQVCRAARAYGKLHWRDLSIQDKNIPAVVFAALQSAPEVDGKDENQMFSESTMMAADKDLSTVRLYRCLVLEELDWADLTAEERDLAGKVNWMHAASELVDFTAGTIPWRKLKSPWAKRMLAPMALKEGKIKWKDLSSEVRRIPGVASMALRHGRITLTEFKVNATLKDQASAEVPNDSAEPASDAESEFDDDASGDLGSESQCESGLVASGGQSGEVEGSGSEAPRHSPSEPAKIDDSPAKIEDSPAKIDDSQGAAQLDPDSSPDERRTPDLEVPENHTDEVIIPTKERENADEISPTASSRSSSPSSNDDDDESPLGSHHSNTYSFFSRYHSSSDEVSVVDTPMYSPPTSSESSINDATSEESVRAGGDAGGESGAGGGGDSPPDSSSISDYAAGAMISSSNSPDSVSLPFYSESAEAWSESPIVVGGREGSGAEGGGGSDRIAGGRMDRNANDGSDSGDIGASNFFRTLSYCVVGILSVVAVGMWLWLLRWWCRKQSGVDNNGITMAGNGSNGKTDANEGRRRGNISTRPGGNNNISSAGRTSVANVANNFANCAPTPSNVADCDPVTAPLLSAVVERTASSAVSNIHAETESDALISIVQCEAAAPAEVLEQELGDSGDDSNANACERAYDHSGDPDHVDDLESNPLIVARPSEAGVLLQRSEHEAAFPSEGSVSSPATTVRSSDTGISVTAVRHDLPSSHLIEEHVFPSTSRSDSGACNARFDSTEFKSEVDSKFNLEVAGSNTNSNCSKSKTEFASNDLGSNHSDAQSVNQAGAHSGSQAGSSKSGSNEFGSNDRSSESVSVDLDEQLNDEWHQWEQIELEREREPGASVMRVADNSVGNDDHDGHSDYPECQARDLSTGTGQVHHLQAPDQQFNAEWSSNTNGTSDSPQTPNQSLNQSGILPADSESVSDSESARSRPEAQYANIASLGHSFFGHGSIGLGAEVEAEWAQWLAGELTAGNDLNRQDPQSTFRSQSTKGAVSQESQGLPHWSETMQIESHRGNVQSQTAENLKLAPDSAEKLERNEESDGHPLTREGAPGTANEHALVPTDAGSREHPRYKIVDNGSDVNEAVENKSESDRTDTANSQRNQSHAPAASTQRKPSCTSEKTSSPPGEISSTDAVSPTSEDGTESSSSTTEAKKPYVTGYEKRVYGTQDSFEDLSVIAKCGSSGDSYGSSVAPYASAQAITESPEGARIVESPVRWDGSVHGGLKHPSDTVPRYGDPNDGGPRHADGDVGGADGEGFYDGLAPAIDMDVADELQQLMELLERQPVTSTNVGGTNNNINASGTRPTDSTMNYTSNSPAANDDHSGSGHPGCTHGQPNVVAATVNTNQLNPAVGGHSTQPDADIQASIRAFREKAANFLASQKRVREQHRQRRVAMASQKVNGTGDVNGIHGGHSNRPGNGTNLEQTLNLSTGANKSSSRGRSVTNSLNNRGHHPWSRTPSSGIFDTIIESNVEGEEEEESGGHHAFPSPFHDQHLEHVPFAGLGRKYDNDGGDRNGVDRNARNAADGSSGARAGLKPVATPVSPKIPRSGMRTARDESIKTHNVAAKEGTAKVGIHAENHCQRAAQGGHYITLQPGNTLLHTQCIVHEIQHAAHENQQTTRGNASAENNVARGNHPRYAATPTVSTDRTRGDQQPVQQPQYPLIPTLSAFEAMSDLELSRSEDGDDVPSRRSLTMASDCSSIFDYPGSVEGYAARNNGR